MLVNYAITLQLYYHILVMRSVCVSFKLTVRLQWAVLCVTRSWAQQKPE